MTDRDLLQQMIARIGKEPRAVKFDDDDHLVELNLAGLDLDGVARGSASAFVAVCAAGTFTELAELACRPSWASSPTCNHLCVAIN